MGMGMEIAKTLVMTVMLSSIGLQTMSQNRIGLNCPAAANAKWIERAICDNEQLLADVRRSDPEMIDVWAECSSARLLIGNVLDKTGGSLEEYDKLVETMMVSCSERVEQKRQERPTQGTPSQ
jgi:hypothetical protein